MSIWHSVTLKICLVGFFVLAIICAFYWQQLDGSFLGLALLLVAFVLAFAFASGEHIASPIVALLKKSQHLSRGEFAGRFFYEGHSEIAELSKLFNKIAQDLGRTKYQGEKLAETFDERVKHITRDMEETIYNLEQKVKNRTVELNRVMVQAEADRAFAKKQDLQIAILRAKLTKFEKVKKVKK